jgi:superfamily II DNA or RNA helicase
MEIKLRNYQKESISRLSEGFKTNKRQVLALTTGGG